MRTRPTTSVVSTTGIASVDGVAADSTTETYIALRLEIENWRWSGVPFYIRTGKLPAGDGDRGAGRLQRPAAGRLGLGLRRRPAGARRVRHQARSLDRGPAHRRRPPRRMPRCRGPITLDVEFADEGGEAPTPYEVLLHAALVGQTGRFKRQDVVEECWRVMQPLLDHPPAANPYAPGSWGPDEAEALVVEHGGWHGPWVAEQPS